MGDLKTFRWLALLALIASPPARAYEEPACSVIEAYADFELREYAPQLAAETEVEGERHAVGNQAFRILAAYIGGENRSAAEIAMTAPVTQEPDGEPIAMTAPVVQEPGAPGRWRFRFVMPAKYTRETLPVPTDPRVRIVEVPARRLAARRYRGGWSETRRSENETALLAALVGAGLEPAGPPLWARYDSPFKPWFLRRNEILVEVRPAR